LTPSETSHSSDPEIRQPPSASFTFRIPQQEASTTHLHRDIAEEFIMDFSNSPARGASPDWEPPEFVKISGAGYDPNQEETWDRPVIRLAVGVVQNPVNLDLNLDCTLGSGSMFGVWLNQTSRTCPCSSSH